MLGTNICASQLSDTEVIAAYKGQARVEGGFQISRRSAVFVSSLFVKKPYYRIQGLLMVMTLALLVYSVAQRRLRQQLAQRTQTVPNQINQPAAWPTFRWVFQLLEGIHRVRVRGQGQVHDHRRPQRRADQSPPSVLGNGYAVFIKFPPDRVAQFHKFQ